MADQIRKRLLHASNFYRARGSWFSVCGICGEAIETNRPRWQGITRKNAKDTLYQHKKTEHSE